MSGALEHEGTMWASNRFWLCPAAHIQPYLDQHGIDGPGAYEVSGKVIKPCQAPPWDPSRLLDPTEYTVPLKNTWIGTSQAYIMDNDGNLAEVLTTPDEDHVAVRADWIEWLEEALPPPGQEDGEIAEVAIFATEKAAASPWNPGPVALFLRSLADHGEDDNARIIAVVMSLNEGGPHLAPPPWECRDIDTCSGDPSKVHVDH
jgi:hypothetical protein